MTKVMVVDDERKMRRILQILLTQMGVECVAAPNGEEALALFAEEQIDLVLVDLKMPGMSGIDLLGRIREVDADVPLVVLTAHGTVPSAVEAMKQGAFDYILKPFDVAAIELVVRKALEMGKYRAENRYLREQAAAAPQFENFIGGSPAMQEIYELIRQVAPTRSPVLITGETGTGKELVASAIHRLSPRGDKLFVALNCTAIPGDLLESELFGHARGAFTGAQTGRAGKFEFADGGTLFLDEIGDMAYPLQSKLLRVLQEGVIERLGTNRRVSVDVRIVSSTNRDLAAAMRQGRFREDLYYRLNVLHLHLPPLRERRGDIPHLASFFLDKFAREMGKRSVQLTPAATQVLEAYDWPGNVRELQNLMERAVVLSSGTQVDPGFFRLLLPATAGSANGTVAGGEGMKLDPAVEELERKLILRALGESSDNKAQAARLLGVSERTLWYKLKRYGL